jgi:hypothetical protein
MMYLKLPRGVGKWMLAEAEHVETDGVWYKLPGPIEGDFDFRKFLEEKGVTIRSMMSVDAPYAYADTDKTFFVDLLRVVHWTEPSGQQWTAVYQNDGYVLGESGQTLEKI